MDTSDQTHFVKELEHLFGKECVLHDKEARDRYGVSTLGDSPTISLAVLIKDREALRRLCMFASQRGIPLYPVSRGCNWGYGSARPPSRAVVVDLSSMDRILAFDEELGTVTVEPGVTPIQLQTFLSENKAPFMVAATGAGGHTSLVGNALERGHSTGIYADRCRSIVGIEVMLADGSIYRSPQFPHSPYTWGIGPSLNGLFSQSNLGIVTSVTFVLAPTPARTEVFAFPLKASSSPGDISKSVRLLMRESGGILSSFRIQNTERAITSLVPYPNDVSPHQRIPEVVVQDIAKKCGLTEWFVTGTIQGNAAVVTATRKVVRALLQPHATRPVFFSTSQRIDWIDAIIEHIPYFKKYEGFIKLARSHAHEADGSPQNSGPSPLVFWKLGKNKQRSLNPDEHGTCGFLFYTAIVPMRKETVDRAVKMIGEICHAHNFEACISLGSMSEHVYVLTAPLLFDKSDGVQRARAKQCYETLIQAGESHGFPRQRATVEHMPGMTGRDANHWKIVRKIKDILDPKGLIAPGRYDGSGPIDSFK